MKAKKALKRLNRVESILSEVIDGCPASARRIAHSAKASVGRARDGGARFWTADIVMIGGAALLKFPFPEVLFWYPILTVFYVLQVALLRRRPRLAAAAGLKAVLLFPAFLRQRSPIPRKEYKRWLSTRANYNEEYLKRTGRWRSYHRLLPSIG